MSKLETISDLFYRVVERDDDRVMEFRQDAKWLPISSRELYRNVVGEASEALEVAVSGYAGTIRADIQRGFDQLSRELTAHFSSSPAVAGNRA